MRRPVLVLLAWEVLLRVLLRSKDLTGIHVMKKVRLLLHALLPHWKAAVFSHGTTSENSDTQRMLRQLLARRDIRRLGEKDHGTPSPLKLGVPENDSSYLDTTR
mmetsp:Transcript_21038/g.37494  ORF Transcript_21038/g.37494 Transcript_21038/m.37494 type:complete len:104 (-) Transcript_21038:4-315(-)